MLRRFTSPLFYICSRTISSRASHTKASMKLLLIVAMFGAAAALKTAKDPVHIANILNGNYHIAYVPEQDLIVSKAGLGPGATGVDMPCAAPCGGAVPVPTPKADGTWVMARTTRWCARAPGTRLRTNALRAWHRGAGTSSLTRESTPASSPSHAPSPYLPPTRMPASAHRGACSCA